MGSFLYWNMHKKPAQPSLVCLCDDLGVDVLVISECGSTVPELLDLLNSGKLAGYTYIAAPTGDTKFVWITRFPHNQVVRVIDGGGLSACRIELMGGKKILLFAVHLPSKLNETDDEQLDTAIRASSAIRDTEASQQLSDTLVFGDFNMNPFDKGMSAVTGFNAVMCRHIAARSITFKGTQYPCFYNPMWSLLGDATKGPPGTHKYSRGLVRFHWNTYDQVIFRGRFLLGSIDDSAVAVVDGLRGKLFAAAGKKWRCESDHLPIHVAIKETS